MPSSTSSQESRVSGGKRTLLERRRRFGPRNNYRTNTMKFKGVVKECEGARAALARRESAHEKARGEADRSVRDGAVAAEENDDDCQVLAFTPASRSRDDDCQVLYVISGSPKLRKYVLPVADSKGVEEGDSADVSKLGSPVPVQGRKRDIDEPKVDPRLTFAYNCLFNCPSQAHAWWY